MLLYTSDFHIERGIWVNITIDYLDYIINYCQENGIRNIVFGGDFFEKATKIHNEAFVPLFMKFMEMKERGLLLYFILGNHDIFNDSNDSLVETFSPFGKVIKDSDTIVIDGYQYDLLSYTKDTTKIPNKSKTLLTHLSITEFAFDNGYMGENNDFSPSNFENYDLVVSGHFHRHQEKKNIVYGGSPYQKNFGEEGDQKGFCIIDGSACKYVPYENAPTHLTIEVKDFDKHDYKNKFVQVRINKKVENFVKLRHILYSKGAIEVKPLFEKEEEAQMNEIKFDTSGSIVGIVRQYLKEVKVSGINNDRLVSIFNKISEEVK